jgi:3-dehydro-L-gulonate-6-phosphate decarboxylase
MSLPLLQVALDQLSLADAQRAVAPLKEEVDVVEVGTILCFGEGLKAVREIRALCPDHIVVADLKVADAGQVLAEAVFSAGASWMTVICSAPPATKAKAAEIARAHGGEIQIELYGHWTMEDAAQWRELGIRQVIYHRGRDAELAGQGWGPTDLGRIAALAEAGMEVSVTGGLDADGLERFQGIPVKAFIAGRGLCQAPDPAAEARRFHAQILRYWG